MKHLLKLSDLTKEELLHVLDVAEKLCNKVVIIKNGRLVAAGDTGELTGGASLESVFMEVTCDDKADSIS